MEGETGGRYGRELKERDLRGTWAEREWKERPEEDTEGVEGERLERDIKREREWKERPAEDTEGVEGERLERDIKRERMEGETGGRYGGS
nr:hypothetical protein BgiMline_012671 [Biomphalaria glabrata]